MARRNILDYKSVLSLLETTGKIEEDRTVSLKDVNEAFVIITDKSRPDTIQRHIDYMCGIRVLQKKAEFKYKIADNWKGILDAMN